MENGKRAKLPFLFSATTYYFPIIFLTQQTEREFKFFDGHRAADDNHVDAVGHLFEVALELHELPTGVALKELLPDSFSSPVGISYFPLIRADNFFFKCSPFQRDDDDSSPFWFLDDPPPIDSPEQRLPVVAHHEDDPAIMCMLKSSLRCR